MEGCVYEVMDPVTMDVKQESEDTDLKHQVDNPARVMWE